jgi:hypothetical protein
MFTDKSPASSVIQIPSRGTGTLDLGPRGKSGVLLPLEGKTYASYRSKHKNLKGHSMPYFFFPKDPALPKANVCITLATLNVNCEKAL